MEACTGRKCCFTTKTPAQLTWRSIRAIRRRFTPRCGRRAVPRGAFTHPRTAQEAGCIARMTAEITGDRKSTRLNSSHGYISYAGFCLKKKINDARAMTPRLSGADAAYVL